ncbi:seizure 6-like protein [Bombina bombina]|uniref:seizure 6-like protein n=1 Tax=Bombina bombina TaxID=8345 RepID=UPI00235ACD75|nr:seizure 6-like protein [Bombina bombina]
MTPCESQPRHLFQWLCRTEQRIPVYLRFPNPPFLRVRDAIMLTRGICQSPGLHIHPLIFIFLILLPTTQAEDIYMKQKPLPTSSVESLPREIVNNRIGKENSQIKETSSQNVPKSGEESLDPGSEKEVSPSNKDVSEAPSTAPNFAGNQTLPTRKKPPSLKQLNIARKRLRPQVTPAVLERMLAVNASIPPLTENVPVLKDLSAETREIKQNIPEFPLWINRRRHSSTIPQLPFQITSHTTQPSISPNSDSIKLSLSDINTSLQADEPVRTRLTDNDLNGGEENQETTTSTIITTTVITTEQNSAQCRVNFHNPEGYIDSTDYPPLPKHNYLECKYNITVYMGYGVELQGPYEEAIRFSDSLNSNDYGFKFTSNIQSTKIDYLDLTLSFSSSGHIVSETFSKKWIAIVS